MMIDNWKKEITSLKCMEFLLFCLSDSLIYSCINGIFRFDGTLIVGYSHNLKLMTDLQYLMIRALQIRALYAVRQCLSFLSWKNVSLKFPIIVNPNFFSSISKTIFRAQEPFSAKFIMQDYTRRRRKSFAFQRK